MTLSAPMKTALLSGALALIAAGSFAGGYLLIEREHDKNTAEAQTLANALALGEHTQSMQMLLADTALSRMELESYFVDPEALVVFLELVEGVARDSGTALTIESVTSQLVPLPGAKAPTNKKEQGPTYPAVTIGAVFEGSWAAVTRFVARLDSLPYGIAITSLNIEQNPDGAGWTGSVSFLAATGNGK